MTTQQDKRRRTAMIAVGVVAVALASAAIGIGTYAAFTDTEEGPEDVVIAGTLDLVIGEGGEIPLFFAQDITPGFEDTVTFEVTNTGTVNGELSNVLTLDTDDGDCTEPEAEAEDVAPGACRAAGDLQDQMLVSVLRGPGYTSPTTPVSVATFATNGFLPASLNAGQTGEYELEFTLPDRPDNNVVQGDLLDLSSTFNLVQS